MTNDKKLPLGHIYCKGGCGRDFYPYHGAEYCGHCWPNPHTCPDCKCYISIPWDRKSGEPYRQWFVYKGEPCPNCEEIAAGTRCQRGWHEIRNGQRCVECYVLDGGSRFDQDLSQLSVAELEELANLICRYPEWQSQEGPCYHTDRQLRLMLEIGVAIATQTLAPAIPVAERPTLGCECGNCQSGWDCRFGA